MVTLLTLQMKQRQILGLEYLMTLAQQPTLTALLPYSETLHDA
jgi:hypothetical protein